MRADLERLVEEFRQRLYLPDPSPLLVTLGALVANRMSGAPVWVQLIGTPSSGRTEILQSVVGLQDVYPASTLTEASLLSGSSRQDHHENSTGGLLNVIGRFGIIVAKDFTSVLSMHREARQAVIAALREVYDGSWTRQLGTDGGLTLEWEGKVGFLGACTPVIDQHHSVMAQMGERFVLYRMPAIDEDQQARQALRSAGRQRGMGRAFRQGVADFFADLRLPAEPAEPGPEDVEHLTALATFVARARSAVVRDGYSREVELVPGAELPARLAKVLNQLRTGLLVIGLESAEVRPIVEKAGLDSIPEPRRSVLAFMVQREDKSHASAALASALGPSRSTIDRRLHEMAAYYVVERDGTGGWRPSGWSRERLSKLDRPFGGRVAPEMSEATPGQTVSETSHPSLISSEELRDKSETGHSAVQSEEAPDISGIVQQARGARVELRVLLDGRLDPRYPPVGASQKLRKTIWRHRREIVAFLREERR
jgi:hypothetical protein